MKPGVVFGPDTLFVPATQREFDMQSYPLPRNRVSFYSADDGFIWRLMTVFRFKESGLGYIGGVCLVDVGVVQNVVLVQQ